MSVVSDVGTVDTFTMKTRIASSVGSVGCMIRRLERGTQACVGSVGCQFREFPADDRQLCRFCRASGVLDIGIAIRRGDRLFENPTPSITRQKSPSRRDQTLD